MEFRAPIKPTPWALREGDKTIQERKKEKEKRKRKIACRGVSGKEGKIRYKKMNGRLYKT